MFGRYAELQSKISTLEDQVLSLSRALAMTLETIKLVDKRITELENKLFYKGENKLWKTNIIL